MRLMRAKSSQGEQQPSKCHSVGSASGASMLLTTITFLSASVGGLYNQKAHRIVAMAGLQTVSNYGH